MKRIARLSIGFSIAGLFLYLIFRQLSIAEIRTAFDNANITLLSLAVVSFFTGYFCRIERWHLMLVQENPNLCWRNCAGPLMASVAANNILPFRAGDLLRAFAFNQKLGISAATSVTTLVVERLLDILMLISLLGVALTYFGMEFSKIAGVGGSFIITIGILILLFLNFPTLFKPLTNWICRYISRFFPGLGNKLFAEFKKVFAALEYISNGHIMLKLLTWSLIAWIAEGFVFWFVALSLPSISNAIAAWFALSLGTLATIIPSTPGYIGTFDYFTSQAMTALGNTHASSTAFAFLVHVVLWLPPLITGGVYLLLSPITQPKINKPITDEK